ncbi:MAG: hypothetical protein H8K07_22690 [Nitrospira sp.]|jgi:GTPase SAR1 family protein|nr:hypothetical protein [Nitrospira sp.]MDI3462845.1 hypothetical protein [Nitrospira sp.]
MFRLFDFSSTIDLPTGQLVVGAVFFLFITCYSTYFIYYRNQEARRLLDLAKNWGKQVEDEAKELRGTKIRLIIGHSVFLVLCLFLAARFCVELLRRF